MPDNIYDINVGQVETPSSGGFGGRGSSIGSAGNSLNALIRYQQKMAEIEAGKQKQATDNANLLFQEIAKNRGLGRKDQESFLGFTPLNPYETDVANRAEEGINRSVADFSKDPTNNNYVTMNGNINKILNDENLIYAAASNNRIKSALKTVEEKGLNIHPYYWDQYNRYLNSKDKSDYDLNTLINPQKFTSQPINLNEDFDNAQKMGLSFVTAEDPQTRHVYIYTTQDNKDQLNGYIKNKYGNNYNLDFERHKLANDETYNQYLTSSNNDEELARSRYIDDAVTDFSDNIATVNNKKEYKADIGLSQEGKDLDSKRKISEQSAIEIKKQSNRLELEEAKQENSKERIELNKETQLAIQEAKKSNIKEWAKGASNAAMIARDKIKKENPKISDDQIIRASSKINENNYDSEAERVEAITNEANAVDLPNDDDRNKRLQDNISNSIKSNSEEYTVFNVSGNKDKHSLVKEQFSKGKGLYDYSSKGSDFTQTKLGGITGSRIKGGKLVATGYIYTKNKDYFDSVPDGYKSDAIKLSNAEIENLNKNGYNFDISGSSEDVYKVPIEIPIHELSKSPLNKVIVSMESGGGNYSAKNPTTSAYGAYQFIDSTGFEIAKKAGLASSLDDYKEKMKDEKFQDKIFDLHSSYLIKEGNKIISKIEEIPQLKSKFNKFFSDIIGKEVSRVPNWLIYYMVHHNGSIDKVLETINGENKVDIENMKNTIKNNGYPLFGEEDIDISDIGNASGGGKDSKDDSVIDKEDKPKIDKPKLKKISEYIKK